MGSWLDCASHHHPPVLTYSIKLSHDPAFDIPLLLTGKWGWLSRQREALSVIPIVGSRPEEIQEERNGGQVEAAWKYRAPG